MQEINMSMFIDMKEGPSSFSTYFSTSITICQDKLFGITNPFEIMIALKQLDKSTE